MNSQFKNTNTTQYAAKLSNRKLYPSKKQIKIGDIIIGADKPQIIAGPCAVESIEQIDQTAKFLKKTGVNILRAGCFKPRTSPYSFQGLGSDGLLILNEIRKKYDLKIITEARDIDNLHQVAEITDILQIGSKNMFDQTFLQKCARTKKPILLKRHFAASLQEFVLAAEYILAEGNDQVILCERGIRTFETQTRFTLDLCGVAYLQEHCNLPICIDPSHAMGHAYGIPALAKAAMAMGVDVLMLEVHPDPKNAKSDSTQQLNFDQLTKLYSEITLIS